MSVQRALEIARRDLAAPIALPAFARVEAAVRWAEEGGEARPPARQRWLSTCGAILAATTMATDAAIGIRLGVPLLGALVLPIALLLLSGWLVHRATLGGQLVSRAVWWSYLLLGLAWSAGPPESLPVAGTVLTIATGMALLSAGRAGLRRRDTKAFDPVAFRGSVLLSMILGIADVQLLSLVGVTLLEADAAGGHPLALFACAALLGIGVWGLSRLRVWAVLANLAANVIVLLVVALALGRASPILWAIVGSAIVQLLLPVRMLVALVRGAPASAYAREPSPLPAVVVISIAIAVSIPLGLWGTYTPRIP